MALKTTTDIEHAVNFLEWLFGDHQGMIYILRSRPAPDPSEERAKKLILKPASFSSAAKVDSVWWSEQGHLWNQVFCTSTIANRDQNNKQDNCVEVPALWVDIDATKKLGISGDEYHKELRDTEEVSAWVRSSANGIQGWFKLKEPIEVDGDKDAFADAHNLLLDIMYYYGGDDKVTHLGSNMRLPGSLNVKPDYDTHYMAQATIYEDNVYSFSALRKRFKSDPDIVPRIVSYAITKALLDCWEEGSRHEISMLLAGTVRKAGMNKAACKNLLDEVCKWFGDREDRSPDVFSTYDKPFEEVATLSHDFPEAHKTITKVVEWWVDLKQVYCKKKGFEDFVPENVDPTKPQSNRNPEDTFWIDTDDWTTKFIGKTGNEEVFCNFVVELKGKVVKSDTGTTAWLAVIHKKGDIPTKVEIRPERTTSWQRFNTDTMPIGLSVLSGALWSQYVAWLDSQCPDVTLVESNIYGFLDVDKGKPTLLLPEVPHDTYAWTGGNNPAIPGAFSRKVPRSEAREYLREFSKRYKNNHEPRYIYPALAWMAATSISAFCFTKFDGFPTLMVAGLTGTGKSNLFEHILGPHYGVSGTQGYDVSTVYAIRSYLTATNICPVITDEFRVESLKDDKKAKQFQNLIRNLYDHLETGRGTQSGEVIKGEMVSPMCVIGEHHYTDPATVQRTFTIRLTRNWVTDSKAKKAEHARREAEREWFKNTENHGKLGSIIVNWVAENIDYIMPILDKAKKLIVDTCPSYVIDRKIKGYACVMAGHLILRKIFRAYELDYMISTEDMLDCIYAAEPEVESERYDQGTIRTLFEATDQIILNALRQNCPLESIVYKIDLDKDVIHFDMGRWFRYINDTGLVSQVGTLTERTAFVELIREHIGEDDYPFIDMPKNHPVFHKNCVSVDMNAVKKQFGINTDQWRGLEGFRDE